jgi:HSP20 family molecular chaperone IbpA
MAKNVSEVAAPESKGGTVQSRGRAEAALRSPVDVYENGDGITLQADMPGVSRDRLTVRVDGETLLLEGNVLFDLPKDAEALYADVRSTVYRRSFTLSRELDTSNIQATLKDGVLTVHIPKRAELRPRKIEVRAG